jgi:hypothetical protein
MKNFANMNNEEQKLFSYIYAKTVWDLCKCIDVFYSDPNVNKSLAKTEAIKTLAEVNRLRQCLQQKSLTFNDI